MQRRQIEIRYCIAVVGMDQPVFGEQRRERRAVVAEYARVDALGENEPEPLRAGIEDSYRSVV